MNLNWVLIILLILFVLLILILFTNIKIIFDYYHGKDKDHLSIKFKALFGLFQYKLNVPVIKVSDDSSGLVLKKKVEKGIEEKDKGEDTGKLTAEDIIRSVKDVKTLIEHITGFYKVIRKFLQKVSVEKLQWNSVVGVGDAAYTGMVAGSLWMAKGSLLGLIGSYMKIKEIPEISVAPSFQGAITQTSLKCMIRFRIGNAILAAIKLIKLWKGGLPQFKTKSLSILSEEKSKTI